MATIEQLQRRILELENRLKRQTDEMALLMTKSNKAMDMAMHSYRLDPYGFLWMWDFEEQKYRRTKMRVMSPEIVDRAIHAHHIADGAITGDKIEDGQIIPGKIADDAVATRNVQDNAITRDKLSAELIEEIESDHSEIALDVINVEDVINNN